MIPIIYQEQENHCFETEILIRIHEDIDLEKLQTLSNKDHLSKEWHMSLGEYTNSLEECEIMLHQTFSSHHLLVKAAPFHLSYILEIITDTMIQLKLLDNIETMIIFNYSKDDDYLSAFLDWCKERQLDYQLYTL